MRKRLLCGIAVIVILLIAFLSQTAIDPDDFAGEWYSVNGQHIYRFEDGIIQCEQHAIELADGRSVSGAYTFSGKSIALFAMGIDGLDTVKELYLIENKEESLLCEHADGSGIIYFVRHNKR